MSLHSTKWNKMKTVKCMHIFNAYLRRYNEKCFHFMIRQVWFAWSSATWFNVKFIAKIIKCRFRYMDTSANKRGKSKWTLKDNGMTVHLLWNFYCDSKINAKMHFLSTNKWMLFILAMQNSNKQNISNKQTKILQKEEKNITCVETMEKGENKK